MTIDAAAHLPRTSDPWRHVPLSLLTVPMSLAGLGLGLRRLAAGMLPANAPPEPLPLLLSHVALALSLASLAIVIAAHIVKSIRHRDQMLSDLTHPVRICFAAGLPMTLVLLAVAALPDAPRLAQTAWLTGTALHAAVALRAVVVWQRRAPIDIAMLDPVWLLPVVGHVLVAHAGVRIGHVETSWLVVGLSLPAWIIVQGLLVYRNFFTQPLPPCLLPTLTIQIGPARLIFLALAELQAGLDPLLRIFYFAGLGTALSLWLPRLPQMLSVPFAMPHWAFSFPLSALASATLAYAERAASPMLWQLGHLLLTVVAGLTAWLTVRTLQVWRAGTFARPEA